MSSEDKRECHLVTGGGGYVGSYMVRALCDLGHKVVLLDVKKPTYVFPEDVRFIQVQFIECLVHVAEEVSYYN